MGVMSQGDVEDPTTYAGTLSFLRRSYTRDIAEADVVVTGVPFDAATSGRPGARFGPRAIRAASRRDRDGYSTPLPRARIDGGAPRPPRRPVVAAATRANTGATTRGPSLAKWHHSP